MRRARWLIPLLVVLPLATPAPASAVLVEGRAYELRDEDGAPHRFSTSLSPVDDGISRATSRVLPGEAPLPPPAPAVEWSYGPLFYGAPERSLEASGSTPPSVPSMPEGGDMTTPDADPATDPSDEGPAAPAPLPGEDAPDDAPEDEPPPPGDDEGATPAPSACAGLCFFVELGLL